MLVQDWWGQIAIAAAIVVAAWRMDGHFITRREFLLQLELIRRDLAMLRERLGCPSREDS